MRILTALVVVAALSVVSCAITRTRFEPYSATSESGQCVVTAVEAHEGDLATLANAGGEIVGTVAASGNAFTNQDRLEASAAHQAALHGGTHYYVRSVEENVSVYRTATTATTTFDGNAAYTTVHPGSDVPVTKLSASIMVIRVPERNWASLPFGLRPIAGKDAPPTHEKPKSGLPRDRSSY